MKTFWDERYDRNDYVYGVLPNEFLVQVTKHIPAGRILCLGEGEGRNAVFLAEQGYDVTAVDSSVIGLRKAKKLAAARGVGIKTVQADLADYDIQPNRWEGIVSIFCHLPEELRKKIHADCVTGLVSGGVMIVEAFTPKQLDYNTGGPRNLELLMTLAMLQVELAGLNFHIAREVIRERKEGAFHTGDAAVVQILGTKV